MCVRFLDTCEFVANGWIILHGIRCDRQDLFLSTAQWVISEHNFGNGSQYKDNTSQRAGCRSAEESGRAHEGPS